MQGTQKGFLRATVFVMVALGVYIYIAEVITALSGGRKSAATVVGITAEAGEAIFWGKGRCWTCHSIGGQGSAIRCPNLGVFGERFVLPIGLRAEERAKERAAQTGEPYIGADYITESHFTPGAYVVEGYKNEMPVVWKPPISLTPDEVLAADLYLQSQGGEVNPDILVNGRFFQRLKAEAAARGAATPVSVEPLLVGDPERGRALFFDPASAAPCAKCHTAIDEIGQPRGGQVGPDLSHVAGTRDIRYIIDSILDPSKDIAGGFEAFLVITTDGRFIAGVKKQETDTFIEIMGAEGLERVEKNEIRRMAQQKQSIMPGNFKEILTMEQFHDLLAYLETLV